MQMVNFSLKWSASIAIEILIGRFLLLLFCVIMWLTLSQNQGYYSMFSNCYINFAINYNLVRIWVFYRSYFNFSIFVNVIAKLSWKSFTESGFYINFNNHKIEWFFSYRYFSSIIQLFFVKHYYLNMLFAIVFWLKAKYFQLWNRIERGVYVGLISAWASCVAICKMVFNFDHSKAELPNVSKLSWIWAS